MERGEMMGYDAFRGIDVGKDSHCLRVPAPDGETPLVSCTVPRDEGEISALLSVIGGIGRVLAAAGRFSGFGSPVVALAREAGMDVAHIPPRRFAGADGLSGEEKTDELDALTLARLPIEMPRQIDPVPEPDGEAEQARVLIRYRHDAVCERTRAYNRVHDALNRCCPPPGRLLSGSSLHSLPALSPLARYGAAGLARARRCDVVRWVRGRKGFGPAAAGAAAAMRGAARSRSAAMPGAEALELTVRLDAARIIEPGRPGAELSAQIGELCAGVPEVAVLGTMAGVGEVCSRTMAPGIGDVSRFASAAKLASYCGVGKCPKESGKRRGGKRRRGHSRRLHAAVMESARIAVRIPGPDRDYYGKKLAGGMNGRQALHALATKRVTIMYAMLKNMEPYRAA